MDISIVSLIATLIVAATPILLAATGELIVEIWSPKFRC